MNDDFFDSPRQGQNRSTSGSWKKPSSDRSDYSGNDSAKKMTTQVPTASNDDYCDSDSDRDSGRKSRADKGNNSRSSSRSSSASSRSSYSSGSQSSSRSRSRSRSTSRSSNRSRSPTPEKKKGDKPTRPKSGRSKSEEKNNPSGQSETDSDSESSYSSDSQSDMTDVSPLPSPRGKKKKHVELNDKPTMLGKPPVKKNRPKSAKTSSSDHLLSADNDAMDLNLLMQAVLEMEDRGRSPSKRNRPQSGKQFIVPKGPTSHNRRNMSFNNDRTRDIDRENQRLMREIMKQATTTSKSAKKKKVPTATLR